MKPMYKENIKETTERNVLKITYPLLFHGFISDLPPRIKVVQQHDRMTD